jgi:hypothetical protein
MRGLYTKILHVFPVIIPTADIKNEQVVISESALALFFRLVEIRVLLVPPYLVYIFFNLLKAVIMKRLLLFMLAIALTTTIAVAQEQQKDYKLERTEWEKKVKNELKLTTDQTTKYDALNTEYNAKMDALTQDASLSMDAQKEKKMALKKEKEGKLFEFLTPEQQEKYKALVEQKMKDMKKPSNQ